MHITQALVFSPDTLAEIPEGANANALDPVRASTHALPPIRVHILLPVRFENTKLLFQFFRFVLFYLLVRELKGTELLWHQTHAKTFLLHRL